MLNGINFITVLGEIHEEYYHGGIKSKNFRLI